MCIYSSFGTIQIPSQLKLGNWNLERLTISALWLWPVDNLSEIACVYVFSVLPSAECSRWFVLFAPCMCS